MIEIKSKKFLLFLRMKNIAIVKKENRHFIDVKLKEYEKLLKEYKKIVNEI